MLHGTHTVYGVYAFASWIADTHVLAVASVVWGSLRLAPLVVYIAGLLLRDCLCTLTLQDNADLRDRITAAEDVS